MYKDVNSKVNFPKQEEEILKFWKENGIFKKSVSNREGCKEFVFFDGPPFATGLPHYGHFVPSTVKDLIPRYKTMKGMKVERRFGWDCHGLPVENLIEQELGLNSKTDIEKYGVENFNNACRESVLRYVNEWEQTITRLGRWVDFENDYKTMDPDFMETIWWVFKQLWDKGLIYEGHYILPYCPRCSTVLSNHELNLGGYKDVYDPAITVKFKVKFAVDSFPADGVLSDDEIADAYLLAWTTTPWTLPSNLGLAVGADIDYCLVKDASCEGELFIIAESRIAAYYKEDANIEVLKKFKGSDLEGLRYEPLFPYFAKLGANKDGSSKDAGQGAFRVLIGDFVSTEDGTGIVHTAPGFGEDDNRIFKNTGVPTVSPIDEECKFTEEVSDYKGVFVKSADKAIIAKLKDENKLFKRDQILHAYPHCWRCSSPLIYRAIGSWFVAVEKFKPNLLKANSKINWQPAHIKAGRFGKWLEGARDWAISRNRFWGNPIPVWKCPSCGKKICIGSRAELKELSGEMPEDLHKQFVDKITVPCECGDKMHRVSEVLDCWFESGSMPYAQQHYPFENKEKFDKHFPADFISEGLDQTRGWFYLLTVLSTAIFDEPAFMNCIVNGLILASDGRKMSKSLKNYTDPVEVINKFGADALRMFLLHSPVVKADDLKFSDDGVRDVLKDVLIPLWNSYSFFVTYANIDGFQSPTISTAEFVSELNNPLDLWILSVTEKLVLDVTQSLDDYDLFSAIDPIVTYIDLLNNWYIRRSRRRFWKSENDSDKIQAYGTLYRALKTFVLVAAPIIPFITESIWQNLKTEDDAQSVHLADYPEYNENIRDEALEFKMETVQKAISMGRSLRYQFNLKIRQPLKAVEIVTKNSTEKKVLLEMQDSIMEELNVKEIVFHEKEDELVEYSAKANFKVLGKLLGSSMKKAAKLIEDLSSNDIQNVIDGSVLSLEVDGKTFDLNTDNLIVNRIEKESLKVINDGTLTIALNTYLTDELLMEGYVRDLIRGIQNLRKECGFSVTDRIELKVWADSSDAASNEALKRAFSIHKDYIMSETLSAKADWLSAKINLPHSTTVDCDNKLWRLSIEKQQS
ncbi:MAG: isoleucine--tRNA ligase [Treponema sp.]|nr:MAG: isoleucine--tRNA ligase [Treponema sp.]